MLAPVQDEYKPADTVVVLIMAYVGRLARIGYHIYRCYIFNVQDSGIHSPN